MPEPIYSGAALLTALTAYADTLEAKARKAFLDATVAFTNEGDLPEMMAELQQGKISIEDLPERIQLLEMNTSEIKTIVGQAVRGGGTITAKLAELDTAWDVTQPAVIESALDYGAKSITGINKTTQKTLSQLISNAIDTGMSRDDLVDKIKQNVGLLPQHVNASNRYEQMLIDQGTSKREVKRLVKEYAERMLDYRANMIARTEVAQAMNIGQMQFWDQMQGKGLLPDNAQRTWMTADDERVCVICGPMDGMLAPLNGMWMTDNGAVSHPTEVHPQCRCAMGLVFESVAKGIPQIIMKFNPYHDKLGRFTTAGGAFSISGKMPASIKGTGSHLAALASAEGGFTFNSKRGEFRRSGFAVSPHENLEKDYSLDNWKASGAELVKQYIKNNAKALAQPNAHIGAWKGEDSQGRMRVFLDVSVVRNSSSSAANLARRHDQLAYFDLGTFTTMRRKADNKYYSYSDDTGKFLDSDEIGKGLDRRGNVYLITPQATQNSDYLKIFTDSVLKSPAVPMKDKVEKFNPYHDAIGRFTTAEGNVTGTTPLGANREVLVATFRQAREFAGLTDDQIYMYGDVEENFEAIREAEIGELHQLTSQGFGQDERAAVKIKGAQTVYDAMTPEEKKVVDALYPNHPSKGVKFIHSIQSTWAGTAGDTEPNSLATQLVAAEMQGIEDVATRVFNIRAGLKDIDPKVINKEITRVKELIASETASGRLWQDELYFHDPTTRDAKLRIGQSRTGINSYELDVVALAVVKAEASKEPIKAVLNAQKRVTQDFLKKATGGAETITIFRGMVIPQDPNKTAWEYKEMFESEATTLRSDSGPLSSWSLSIDTALKFTEGDMSLSEEMWSQKIGSFSTVLQANVPVSSIVASSAFGFGCLVEQEVIVDGSKFDFKALGANVEADIFVDDRGVYKGIETIDLDRYLVNQDWIKALADDTYEALNLDPKKIAKFNPYHDNIGRFTTAQGNSTGSAPVAVADKVTYVRRKPTLGVTGEPNPSTGKVMSNVEFGDTMETLFRQRVGRLAGFKKMFGGGLRQIIRRKGGARTGALDFKTKTHGIEVKSININSKDKRVKIDRKSALAKSNKAKELGVKGSIVVQVVDFDRGRVDVYGWDKGFKNTSKQASPKSRNIQFHPQSRFEPLGSYRFNKKQWEAAQKATARRDNKGNVIGSWGDYEVTKLSPNQELDWKTELIKRRNSWSLPRPEIVERIFKAKQSDTTDDGRAIKGGDTVIQLVEQGGYFVPYIYEAQDEIKKFNPYHDKIGRFTFSPSTGGIPIDEYYPENTERFGEIEIDMYLSDGESSYYDPDPKQMRATMFEFNDCFLRLTASNKNIDPQTFAEFLDAYGYMTEFFPGCEVGLLAFDRQAMGNSWGWANTKLLEYVRAGGKNSSGVGPQPKDFVNWEEYKKAQNEFVENERGILERATVHINSNILDVATTDKWASRMAFSHTEKICEPVKTKANPYPENVAYHVPINTTPSQATMVHEIGHVIRYKLAEVAPTYLNELENKVLKVLSPKAHKRRVEAEERTKGGSLKGLKFEVGTKGTDGTGTIGSDATQISNGQWLAPSSIRRNLEQMPFGSSYGVTDVGKPVNLPAFIVKGQKGRSEIAKENKQAAELGVSKYAGTNGDELFAELLSEAICSNNPRPAAKAMLEGMEELWPILQANGAFD